MLPGADGVLGLGLSSRAGARGRAASVLDALLGRMASPTTSALRGRTRAAARCTSAATGARAPRQPAAHQHVAAVLAVRADAAYVEAVAGGGQYAQPSCAGAGCELLDSGSRSSRALAATSAAAARARRRRRLLGRRELPTLTFRAGGRDWRSARRSTCCARTARGALRLRPRAARRPMRVLGAPFFRRHYAVFARHRIGPATQRLHEAGTVAAAAAAAPRRADQWLAARDATPGSAPSAGAAAKRSWV